MKLLCIETCLGFYSVAVFDADRLLSKFQSKVLNEQAENLAKSVLFCMNEANITFAELDSVAVTNGPGSFTGLRIGLSFVKGLKISYPKLEIFSVSTLELLAFSQKCEKGMVAINAGKGQFYTSKFKDFILLEEICLQDAQDIDKHSILHEDYSVLNESLGASQIGFLLFYKAEVGVKPSNSLYPVYIREPDAIVNNNQKLV